LAVSLSFPTRRSSDLMLARELGLLYIDTGAMYRAAALAVVEAGVDTNDAAAVAAVAQAAQIELVGEPDNLRVLLDGRDVTEAIRSEEHTSELQSRSDL